MGLINSIASWVLRKRIYQIEMFIKHPIETQMEVFHSLLTRAAKTELGQKYGFGDIDSVKTFQERVPVSGYEELFPYIEKMLKGEKSVLWPGEVRWFSKSSGTTNDRSKYIPVTKESLNDCHFKGGKDMGAVYLHNHPGSKLFDGKALAMGGSHEINKMNGRSYYGDLSAVLIQNTPFFFELFRSPGKQTALLGEWETKIARMAQEVVDQNVTNLIGVPTWTLVLIKKLYELRPEVENDLHKIWPNLEVFFHGGVSFRPYRGQFKSLIPSAEMNYVETYNASEGFFGLQNESDRDDLLLMLDYGIFYEFLPLDEVGKPFPKSLTLEEVETGVNYALVITTNGGLWRYLIGDTVTFTNLSPFKVQVAGRVRHFINAFGEELMVENADRAIADACERTGAEIEEYTACPVYFEGNQNGCHEWLIEFTRMPDDIAHFRDVLDRTLRTVNSDYDAKRYKDIALRAPVVRVMAPGTFYRWMQGRGKLGGQNKVPRLSNTREYTDSILEQFSPVQVID